MNPILASLGVAVQNELIPHRWLVESLIVPSDTFDLEEAGSKREIPLISSLNLILVLNPIFKCKFLGLDINENIKQLRYPWSKEDLRQEVYEDWEPEFGNVVANRALLLGRILERDYDSIMESQALKLIHKPDLPRFLELCASDIGLKGSLVGAFEDNLIDWNNGLDPVEVVDEIESDPKFYYRRGLTIQHATTLLHKVENLYFKLVLRDAPKVRVNDTSSVLLTFNKLIKGSTASYWEVNRSQ